MILLVLAGCLHPPAPDDTAPTDAVRDTLLVISDSGHGRLVFTNPTRDQRTGESCLRELIGDLCPSPAEADDSGADTASEGFARCLTFGIGHERVGDAESGVDHLELAYARYLDGQTNLPGAVVRYVPSHPPQVEFDVDTLTFAEGPLAETCATPSDEALCGFRMPHQVVTDPVDGARVVADTLNNRVVWFSPPASPDERVGAGLAVLDSSAEGWGEARYPNNVERDEHDGRQYLLVSYKGSDPGVTGNAEKGRIMLWDVSDRARPARVWAYPPEGYLAAVHGAALRTVKGRQVLLYAHAFGASASLDTPDVGSVGLAEMAWDSPPTYLGDLVADAAHPQPLGFVRAVDVLDEGAEDRGAVLLVTDSACENQEAACDFQSGVLQLALPELPAAGGASGAWTEGHEELVFTALADVMDPYRDTLKYPFQALPLRTGAVGPTLGAPAGQCP